MGIDVEVQITINCPVTQVADFACDPLNAPRWYRAIDRASWASDPPLRVGSLFAFQASFLGKSLDYTYEVVEFTPHECLVMATAEGPFPMETTYRWSPIESAATQMFLRNRGEPAGFSRLARPLMQSAVRKATTADLAALRDLLESGG